MAVAPADLAKTLRRRYRRAGRRDAERRDELRRQLEAVLTDTDASERHRIWLIGSLAHGYWGPRSDVDLVLEDASPEEAAELWRTLDSRLGVAVELLRLEELDERFVRRVLEHGIPLHES